MNSSWSLLATGIMLIPIAIMLVGLAWLLWSRRMDKRRDPLTVELKALPGASLQKQLNADGEKFVTNYFTSVLTAVVCVQFILVSHISADLSALRGMDYVLIGIAICAGCFMAVRLTKYAINRRKLHDGLRAEMATAQELSSSLQDEVRLIHDVQAESFNIDHVVITCAGVFAVETKSRRKPPAGNGSPAVDYDGQKLRFPTWDETAPLEQAERQAKWLRQYLQKETGKIVPVIPVVSLPGWFIRLSSAASQGTVKVINPKAAKGVFLTPRGTPLDKPTMAQMANAVEKLAACPELI